MSKVAFWLYSGSQHCSGVTTSYPPKESHGTILAKTRSRLIKTRQYVQLILIVSIFYSLIFYSPIVMPRAFKWLMCVLLSVPQKKVGACIQ